MDRRESCPSDASRTSPLEEELVAERYRYILRRIETLNEAGHRMMRFYYSLASAIVGAGVAVFVGWKKLGVSPALAETAVFGLVLLLLLLAVFVVLSLVANLFSWMAYRREEAVLSRNHAPELSRDEAKWSNAWRWTETYDVLFVICSVSIMWAFVGCEVIPRIR